MGSLSKLARECRECQFVDKCNNKRMEAYGCLEMPNITVPSILPSAATMTEPILRETMTIMINGKPSIVYKDEIEKQLYKHLYPHLGLQYGT